MKDDIRPKGTVEVKCSTPNCNWHFWLASNDIRLPSGPFYCASCSEHATYEFVCSHRQTAAEFIAEVRDTKSLLRSCFDMQGDYKLRVTVERIVPGRN